MYGGHGEANKLVTYLKFRLVERADDKGCILRSIAKVASVCEGNKFGLWNIHVFLSKGIL